MATATGKLAELVRVSIVPNLFPPLFRLEAVRTFAFRTVSQLSLSYRGGPLSEGVAGGVRGGDRLPWVTADGADNHGPLRGMTWQVHVYGARKADLAALRLPTHVCRATRQTDPLTP